MTPHLPAAPVPDRRSLVQDLHRLGVRPGDAVMVHASLKAIGPVEGGARAVAEALLEAVGPAGGLMGYASWDRSPYEETLNGARPPDEMRDAWPAFDPETAGVYRGFGLLNAYIRELPGARRSAHPDASMVAAGGLAGRLVEPHRLGQALGPGSPLERFVELDGRVLLLGAGPDAVTVLHYAEAVADIAGKRRVSIEMPVLGPDGERVWRRTEEYDSNGILDCYAGDGPDAVERIVADYIAAGHGRQGRFGGAPARLFEAPHLAAWGKAWLEARHPRERGRSRDPIQE